VFTGSLALLIPRFSTATSYVIGGVFIAAGLLAVWFLEGVPFERQTKLQKSLPFT
jgi:hypothetical protein